MCVYVRQMDREMEKGQFTYYNLRGREAILKGPGGKTTRIYTVVRLINEPSLSLLLVLSAIEIELLASYQIPPPYGHYSMIWA